MPNAPRFQVLCVQQLPRADLLTFVQVHDSHYLQRFLSSDLTPSEERRIGFGEAVRSTVLIERTLSEVAGE